ncbi:hypothetical protein VTN00DRAFT_1316 [Thermoascus crustaceus]|uniref:uncharacterized protein n=1 Tax=Thermoascus crustaceus TaxID=5088 RepID=UPI003743E1EC
MNLRAGRNERAVSVAQEYRKARARSTAGDKPLGELVSMGRNQGNRKRDRDRSLGTDDEACGRSSRQVPNNHTIPSQRRSPPKNNSRGDAGHLEVGTRAPFRL